MDNDSNLDSTVLLILAVAWFFILVALPSHCTTSAPRHDNNFGAVIEYTNPLIYNFGIVVDGAVVRADARTATNLRFQPFGTFELYTEQILLCGPPTDELIKRVHGPVVLVYKRQAHEAVSGIGCHDLEGVFSVGEQK